MPRLERGQRLPPAALQGPGALLRGLGSQQEPELPSGLCRQTEHPSRRGPGHVDRMGRRRNPLRSVPATASCRRSATIDGHICRSELPSGAPEPGSTGGTSPGGSRSRAGSGSAGSVALLTSSEASPPAPRSLRAAEAPEALGGFDSSARVGVGCLLGAAPGSQPLPWHSTEPAPLSSRPPSHLQRRQAAPCSH